MAQKQKKVKSCANRQAVDYKPPKETEASAAATLTSAAEALEKLEVADSKVKAIHGANDGILDGLVGQKVGAVRASLAEAFNIPADAKVFINGEAATDETVLKSGDVLEFLRSAGVSRQK